MITVGTRPLPEFGVAVEQAVQKAIAARAASLGDDCEVALSLTPLSRWGHLQIVYGPALHDRGWVACSVRAPR